MAGLHLQQLLDACLDLESAFNTALQAASLTEFTDVTTDPPTGTPTCPYLVVTLGGWRRREPAGIGVGVQDTVLVSFRIETDQGEVDALAYEGVVASVALGNRPSLTTAVTDATLTSWQLDRGTAGIDPDGTGDDPWTTVVKLRARLEW